MNLLHLLQSRVWQSGRSLTQVLAAFWQSLQLAAMLLVLAVSPSSYTPANRLTVTRHTYTHFISSAAGFALVCALVTAVLTRIVLVTALSYGLSQYALQLVIRVLVLELIPLTAALFVALRCTIPDGVELAAMQSRGEWDAFRQRGLDPLTHAVLPRMVAGLFAGISLSALSCVITLCVAYFAAYGIDSAALAAYTRLFGQVFTPVVSLILLAKTLFFCLAVSLIPMAFALYDAPRRGGRSSAEMRSLVRMFVVILLIELLSLLGNYY